MPGPDQGRIAFQRVAQSLLFVGDEPFAVTPVWALVLYLVMTVKEG